ncbi:glutathione S-transferase family protein [Pseudobacteriovorax antillogorgiicola]|uniref:Glutathione S-transferase n=1 Tax=Pseudobacteriovorax antillogorgiicola TaxID=1513793 RepID=A0A1Y6B7R2_9BACT|nr:glutathione S-transferase family protein [Pseudobacteriovorax antillogorgiicola]TCS58768.1 glutathione S-transferase [Pseudobacteriovorax antillogorgiicola]SME94951.1 glutathione S-transferase [Pseudobacteriovorax antillogorgiicola]
MADKNVILYTNPQSRGLIVQWMLEEIACPYEIKEVAYGSDMKSSPYRDINPMGKVPSLVHGDQIVTECAAICAYLADAFPEAQLAPAPSQRGNYYRWLFFAAGPLEAAVTNQSLELKIPEGKEQTIGYGDYDTTIATLVKAVCANPYIAGDKFSAADVYVGSHIAWGTRFNTIPLLEEFKVYLNKLSSRPAFQKILGS